MEKHIICGIYFLVNNKKVVYVGQSTNILSRIVGHGDKIYKEIYYLICKQEELEILETHFIVSLNPEYNKTHSAMISLNKYRLHNTKLDSFQKHCIETLSATLACNYLNIGVNNG